MWRDSQCPGPLLDMETWGWSRRGKLNPSPTQQLLLTAQLSEHWRLSGRIQRDFPKHRKLKEDAWGTKSTMKIQQPPGKLQRDPVFPEHAELMGKVGERKLENSLSGQFQKPC